LGVEGSGKTRNTNLASSVFSILIIVSSVYYLPIAIHSLSGGWCLSITRKNIAFWLAAIPGLFGIFGLGHLYIRERGRGYVFLSVTAVLAVLVSIALFAPNYMPPLLAAPGLPTIWAVGWFWSMWDIHNLTRLEKRKVSGIERNVAS
jgi:hypothetical protein